jgi:hypothetical protein
MTVPLHFELGDSNCPQGHAVLYFSDNIEGTYAATYVVVLPIQMDIGKYLPPLLASQFGSLAGDALGGGMNCFAAPPMPEVIEDIASIRQLATLRGDDLLYGGQIPLNDPVVGMQAASDAVHEYSNMYALYADSIPAGSLGDIGSSNYQDQAEVQRVLYQLMNEQDRMAELSKLVVAMRFAAERQDDELARETEISLAVIRPMFPSHFWLEKLLVAAGDLSEAGARVTQLHIERCYKLLAEDFAEVEVLESRIKELDSQKM